MALEEPYFPIATRLTVTVVSVVLMVLITIMTLVIRRFRKTSVVMWLLEKLGKNN